MFVKYEEGESSSIKVFIKLLLGRRDYYTLRKYYERDAAYLGLIKGFLQDCPQLILQLYILAVRDHESLDEPSIGEL